MEFKTLAQKLSWKGIIVGCLVDNISSIILAVAVDVYLISFHHIGNLPLADQKADTMIFLSNPFVVYPLRLIGGLFSVLAGYITASFVQEGKIANAVVASIFTLIISLWGVMANQNVSVLTHLFLEVLTVGAYVLGGYLNVLRSGRVVRP